MSTEKKTQYCGSAKELGSDLLIELNINQLREILANAENAKFKYSYTDKAGNENEVIKLKAVKRKEPQGYNTHFLCLNDYVKDGEKTVQKENDLPF